VPVRTATARRWAATAIVAVAVTGGIGLFTSSTIPAEAAVTPGQTLLVSTVANTDDQLVNDAAQVSMSGDGGSVAFTSRGDFGDLTDTDENWNNVFVHDLRTDRTVQISRGFDRPDPPPTSSSPPPDGPILKFAGTPMLNLAGAQPTQPAVQAPDGNSRQPSLSADGRFVAFTTQATNIIEADADNDVDLVICDRDPDSDGEFDELVGGNLQYRYLWVTQNSSLDTNSIYRPQLSADGTRVLWVEDYTPAGADGNVLAAFTAVVTASGKLIEPPTVESVDSRFAGNGITRAQYQAALSADGNHVAVAGEYGFPTNDNDGRLFAVTVTDLTNGVVERVDRRPTPGEGGGDAVFIGVDDTTAFFDPTLSADGSVVGFVVDDVDNEYYYPENTPDILVLNREASPLVSTVASLNRDGRPANGLVPTLSADGRYLTFVTDALNMHDGIDHPTDGYDSCINRASDFAGNRLLKLNAAQEDPDGRYTRTFCQVVMRDLVADAERAAKDEPRVPATLLSPGRETTCAPDVPDDGTETCAGNDESPYDLRLPRGSSASMPPVISADGLRVAFESSAFDLVEGDDNRASDAFVRVLAPSLRGEPVTFGEVTVGETATRTATLQHVGFGPVDAESITITGPDAGLFRVGAQTCVGVKVHQPGSCLVSVEFSPTEEGDRNAVLTVTVRGQQQPFTVRLTGTGRARVIPRDPQVDAGPDPLDFGSRLLLSNGPESTVTITNTGGLPLDVVGVSVVLPTNPEDFTVGTNTCVGPDIAPNATCTIGVRFSPTFFGERAAVLRIDDNAPGGPHLVQLRGRAGQPLIDANPGVLPAGGITVVSGTGFPANRDIVLRYERFSPEGATVRSGPDGTFRAQLLIFPNTTAQSRMVVATVKDQLPVLDAKDPLLVVDGSVVPPNFTIRD